MLEYLHIENIAVAKNIDIYFTDGLNVLTGETGAGKSIVINSINMLLGAKMQKDIIRYGEERAVVSAIFSSLDDSVYELCDELDISYDKEDNFLISRTFNLDGKNSVKINSRPVTLAQLKALGAKLLNIHGQNDSQNIMNKINHLYALDEFNDCDDTLIEYKGIYSKLNDIKSKINSLHDDIKQKGMMTDILQYQIKEISSAKLKSNDEEEKLLELKRKLKSAEQLSKLSSIVYRALLKSESGVSACVLIEKAIDALYKLVDIESEATEMIGKLNNIKFELEDIAEKTREIGNLGEIIDDPKKQLELVEDRLSLINKLERKYGSSIADILKYKDDAEQKLKDLEGGEELLTQLKDEYLFLEQKANKVAEKLSQIRLKGAKELSQIVKKALVSLDMPKVNFEINVTKNEKEGKSILSQYGYDDVEFFISTNPGEELASMNKIASGGELSRIMLALKSALSDKIGAQTVVFDEIDTGVSGSTAQKIGVRLSKISNNSQVICVTHSAQIAAFANTHMLIKKNEINDRSETKIFQLSENERIEEIARIIGGANIIDIQYEAAKELINESKRLLNS